MDYIPRQLERQVTLAAGAFGAVVLTGPRRCGKTFLFLGGIDDRLPHDWAIRWDVLTLMFKAEVVPALLPTTEVTLPRIHLGIGGDAALAHVRIRAFAARSRRFGRASGAEGHNQDQCSR